MSSINNIIKKLRENRILNERKDYEQYDTVDLVNMSQDGDQLAIETLITRYADHIKRMTSKYFLGSGDKDDLLQIATIGFWEAIMSWDKSGSFEAYSGMIMKRRITDELRKEEAGKSQINQMANYLDDIIKSDGEGGEQTLGDILQAKGDSPEEIAVASELQRAIEKYLEDTFTAKEREVLQKSIEGYKTKEISEVLGMSYKQVDNILYKVKYKLKEYLKTASFKESKKMDKDIEFSEEEKKILESALHNIKVREDRKIKSSRLKESYENYTEIQLDNELEEIESNVKDMIKSLKDKYYDDRDDILDNLEDQTVKLTAMEEYLTDDQYNKYEEIMDMIIKAESTEYEGPAVYKDPYAERGLRRSDFY